MVPTPTEIATPRVCALASRRAAQGVPGVARVGGSVLAWLVGGVPGVTIRIEERGRLYVEIDIVAHLGQTLPFLGDTLIEAVREALKPLPGVHLMAVDIHFTGIRFDKRALPLRKPHPG